MSKTITWDELREACASVADGAFMATVQPDGRPHLAWVGIGFASDHLWTATYASSRKARNLRHASAVALHWPERPDRLIFMRATARVVDERDEASSLWGARVLPYDQEQFYGSVDNPELLFVELTVQHASVHDGDPTSPPAVWRPPV